MKHAQENAEGESEAEQQNQPIACSPIRIIPDPHATPTVFQQLAFGAPGVPSPSSHW
jgi:hypothetical protein